MYFTAKKWELTGDKEFVYDLTLGLEGIRMLSRFKRDPQLLDYYNTSLLLGAPRGVWSECTFQFGNIVMECELQINKDSELVCSLGKVYLPVSLFDEAYVIDGKDSHISGIVAKTYIKRVDGYQFKNREIRDIIASSNTTCYIDEGCFNGVYFRNTPTISNKSLYICTKECPGGCGLAESTNPTRDAYAYMENCTIHTLELSSLIGLDKFLAAGNKIDNINYFTVPSDYLNRNRVVQADEIYNSLVDLTRKFNEYGLEGTDITVCTNIEITKKRLLDLQLEEYKKAITRLDYPLKQVSVSNLGGHLGESKYYDRVLIKEDKEAVRLRFSM